MTTPSAKADGFLGHARANAPRFVPKAQSEPQNITGGVDITVNDQSAVRARMVVRYLKQKRHTQILIRGLAMIGLALMLLCALTTPALAIDAPDSEFTITSITAYESLLETDDMLIVVDCTIDYSANPDENVTEAFMIRLMDGTDELGSQAPYAFYDDGYDRGVVAIYWDEGDAPTWAGDYTLRLEGNPTLDWGGSRPVTSTTSITWDTGSNDALASQVLYLADQLEVAWSIDMIETTPQGSRLSDYGESYFTNVMPYLTQMCSDIFSGSSASPDVVDREDSTEAADELTDRTSGTLFDLTDPADAFGMSGTTFGIGLTFLGIILALGFFAKQIPGSGMLTMLLIPILIIFTLMGWFPLGWLIVLAVLSLAMTIYIFTMEKSTA